MSTETALNDYIGRFLLRYFRSSAERVNLDQPLFNLDTDLELLRLQWSISCSIITLFEHIKTHPHEMQAVLEVRSREEDGRVRGRIDARASEIRRLITGYPTTTVSIESMRTFRSGPNQVLLWVIEHAWRLAQKFKSLLNDGASYSASVDKIILIAEQIKRSEGIRQASREMNIAQRPSAAALLESTRSRRQIYVFAADAYKKLQLLESGDSDAIYDIMNNTVLGPLQPWQRFELAVGFGISQALAKETKKEISLAFLSGGNKEPIATVGRLSVFWQNQTGAYEKPEAEPSEALVEKIIEEYGLQAGSDRPDIVVYDNLEKKIVAVFEVKFFTDEQSSGADALRLAVSQVVRYSRGYHPTDTIDELLDNSGIALIRSEFGIKPEDKPYGVPWVMNFDDFTEQRLAPWAQKVVLELSSS